MKQNIMAFAIATVLSGLMAYQFVQLERTTSINIYKILMSHHAHAAPTAIKIAVSK